MLSVLSKLVYTITLSDKIHEQVRNMKQKQIATFL